MTALVDVHDLERSFGSLQAVAHLSFSVDPGEIFGIVGPDGAGKTTVLRILATVLDGTGGSAMIDGLDVSEEPDRVKDRIAYMSQRFGLYPDLTVEENVDLYADLYGLPKKGRSERVDELLRFSYMDPFKKRRAGALSGGMKQKLQLVCALIHTPKVLLLDEPTNGVDPVSRRDFWRMLFGLSDRGVATVVTTAYMDEAERCHRIALMDKGRFLGQGTLEQVRSLMSGRLYSFTTRAPRKAAEAFRTRDGWHSTPFGDSIHLECPDDVASSEIEAILRTASIPHGTVEETIPSLEDVFVSVVSEPRGERAMAPPGEIPPFEDGTAVTANNLTKTFGDFTAVNDLSFEVFQGEIFGFLGPNGAGKSTTIRMLCGLLSPSSGRAVVAEVDVGKDPESVKWRIGYMSQKFSLYEDLTVEENLNFYGGIYGLDDSRLKERKEWALDMADLSRRRGDIAGSLTGGWRQKLALACAVLHEPPIVFLDEPTSGVDPVSRRTFWELINDMSDRGITVFVTTHYMEEAEYCNRLAMIFRGDMIALGTPGELKKRTDTSSMEDAFVELVEGGEKS
ncbi:ABC transporter related protein [Dethiosulfovibrio peptidovorans DSM 11002]|uniref:ABC transporter related protein n=1 Tax=Dethiosulfovibrio peptidovorans DSM 11002 TaxID=469381 RepID=D2Z516_9BACT|nr:ATP-binding cassette domain-containing protein [Dethiosulfovibrio peptidovorans]EFC90575.1 ABC transporter related protein [Dethiosulfovibrio peptidovorans DSM 11002]